MPPKLIYFDLGKVLLDFSFERMCRQMGEVAGVDSQQVAQLLAAGMQADYETGRLDTRSFYERFCRESGTNPHCDAFFTAFNDIFTPIRSMLPVVANLYQAGYRLGLLSNTCESHWNYCLRKYRILREFFAVRALSYEIRAMKPAEAVFCRAADLAGCRPDEIFYTDDMSGHVAGARRVGVDAVVYTSTFQLVKELRQRSVCFNY